MPRAAAVVILTTMDAPGPLHLLDMAVDPAWIDYNEHMNVGYYVVAFDRATDELIDRVGMDASYRAASGCTVFVLETHLNLLRELRLGDAMAVDVQVIDCDAKRIHYFMTMRRHGDDGPAATTEIMLMHVDLASGRAQPMPHAVRQAVASLHDAHRALAPPAQLGSRIGIRRR